MIMFCLVLVTLGLTGVFSDITQTTVTSSALIQIVQQLANQTKALENRLNQEVQSQLALLQEVQLKNDQNQFLRDEVHALNQTLEKEREEKTKLEKRVLDLESKMKVLEATVAESQGCCREFEGRLTTLENSTRRELPTLNQDIKQLNQTIDSILSSAAAIQSLNLSQLQTDHSEINVLDNKTAAFMADLSNQSREVKYLNMTLNNTKFTLVNLKKDLENANRTLHSTIATVVANLRGATDAQLNKTLDREVNKLLVEIRTLNATVSKRLGDELNRTVASEKTIQSVSSGFQNLQNQLIFANTKLQNLNLNVSELKAAVNSKAPVVLFSVSRPAETVVQHPHFTKVIYNTGGAFDPTTSSFVAPLSGQYLFTATIHKSTQGSGISCWIRLNGSLLVSINAHAAFPGTDASGSNTVTVLMSKGDRLELSECQGDSRFSQDGSTFSGVLLSKT